MPRTRRGKSIWRHCPCYLVVWSAMRFILSLFSVRLSVFAPLCCFLVTARNVANARGCTKIVLCVGYLGLDRFEYHGIGILLQTGTIFLLCSPPPPTDLLPLSCVFFWGERRPSHLIFPFMTGPRPPIAPFHQNAYETRAIYSLLASTASLLPGATCDATRSWDEYSSKTSWRPGRCKAARFSHPPGSSEAGRL